MRRNFPEITRHMGDMGELRRVYSGAVENKGVENVCRVSLAGQTVDSR